MSLWLVPPLVLLPSAVRNISKANTLMWIKLVIVHFGLFVGSNALCSAIYDGVDALSGSNPSSSSNESEEGQEAISTTIKINDEKEESASNNNPIQSHVAEMEMDDIDVWLGMKEGKEIEYRSDGTVYYERSFKFLVYYDVYNDEK